LKEIFDPSTAPTKQLINGTFTVLFSKKMQADLARCTNIFLAGDAILYSKRFRKRVLASGFERRLLEKFS
jgi:hypothetical protein